MYHSHKYSFNVQCNTNIVAGDVHQHLKISKSGSSTPPKKKFHRIQQTHVTATIHMC
jgi:hypothetical protein